MKYQNDLILRAAKGEITERVPVWVMRQAGRILPEYRAIRASISGFKELVETPELASEVTIQPVDILGVDAAIIFSDILVIPEAMGCIYEMEEKVGPRFPNPIRTESDINKLVIPDPEDKLKYVLDAVRLTVKNLHGRVPVIGFAGAPFTILAYMIEGKGSKTFSETKKFLYTEPVLAHKILEKITLTTISYLKAKVDAGAAMLQLFDSWAGILSPSQYTEFAMPYISRICDSASVPITVFSKGAFFALEEINQTSCNTIGLDWTLDPKKVREIIGFDKTLQGNLDPCLLYSSDKKIVTETISMLKSFGGNKHIANLGHGVYPDTSPEKVKLFIDTIKNYRF